MPTTWYFRNTNASTGPTGKASTDTDNFPAVPADKNTPKDMIATKGSGQVSIAGAYNNAGAAKKSFMRIFVSPALAAQTITGGQANFKIAIAIRESNALMDLKARAFVYVWRSGVGNVKTLIAPQSCPTEHGANEIGCVITATGQAGNYATSDGDRIIVETWLDILNTRSTSYTATNYYDGTTDVVEGTASTNAAGFFTCPQTLTLSGPTPNAFNKIAYLTEPPSAGWNKIAYESEPPVSSAWNKIKYG
jgi:hypothetical protein